MQEELSSTKLIIKLLQTEGDTHNNLNPSDTWSTTKLNNSRSSTAVRQPKEVHGISTHYMPTTANVLKYYLTLMKLRIGYRQQMNLVDIPEDNKGSLNVRKPLLKIGTARIQKSQITLA